MPRPWSSISGECTYSDGFVVNVARIKGLECIFYNITTVVTEFALLLAFIVLVVGGLKYLTSGGDSKATESAQNTITYAIIGIALLVIIWLLLGFIKDFTNIDVSQFNMVVP